MTEDFFRNRLATMIEQSHPLAVLATRLSWDRMETAVTPRLAHKPRLVKTIRTQDLLGQGCKSRVPISARQADPGSPRA